MNQQLNIVFVGEVDCGKSTLIGRLLYDTDSVSSQAKKELQKTCKDLGRGLEFAYLLDSFQEEREQEFTLDMTQASLKAKDREFLLIDVPGHQQLIKNMLTGASSAETAILVVDVKKSLEEQTKRHLYILKFLGVTQSIVVINKMDSVSYKQEEFKKVEEQLNVFLKQIGLKAGYVIPVSAKEGENLLEKSSKLLWYNGPCLLKALNNFTVKHKADNDFRFPVQDIYEIKKEKVLVGTIASGRVNKGDSVWVSPSQIQLKVRVIKAFDKFKVQAGQGESIGLVFDKAINLNRGEVVYKGKPPDATCQIQAKIFCLKPLEVNQELSVSCATQKVRAKISQIKESIDTATLKINKDINRLKPNEAAEVAITAQEPLVIERFSDLPELGRFIIEKDNEISAAGITL
jgi:small GTP-binding protein